MSRGFFCRRTTLAVISEDGQLLEKLMPDIPKDQTSSWKDVVFLKYHTHYRLINEH